MHNFLGHPKVTGLNHIVFAFGHLNAIKYFKCPINHKTKCSLLLIFYKVDMSSFMIYKNVLATLINQHSCRKTEKINKLEKILILFYNIFITSSYFKIT